MIAHVRVSFLEAVRDATRGNPKVQRRSYLPEGPIPVVDQGQDFIVGYTTADNVYAGQLPVVLFGDHTRIFKYVDFPFALGADGVKVLVPREGFEASFLYWCFRSTDIPSAGYRRHFRFLRDLSVCKPPLVEQRRIVGILNRAAKIERLRTRAQQLMGKLIPALFIRIFGDPVDNPMGWTMKRLGELGSVGSGSAFPKKEQGKKKGDFPFLKVSDMNHVGNDTTILSWTNVVSDETRAKLGARVFPMGSVVFPKVGAAIATNKKRLLGRPSCVDNNVMAIVPGVGLDAQYLYGLMLQKDLSDFASKAEPPSMRKTTVENWQIPYPPLTLQRRYAGLVEAVRVAVDMAGSASDTASNLTASLMSCLLRDGA